MCEAEGRRALSRGIQGFKISAANRLNKMRCRSGKVFADRYHEEILATPTQVRNCLVYVMNNWRRHGEDRGHTLPVDPYSTGMWFEGWREGAVRVPDNLDPLPSRAACTWLLSAGWRRVSAPSVFDVPGPRSPD